MISKEQALLDGLIPIVHCIIQEQNIKRWAPAVYEFAGHLFTNPLLVPIIQKIKEEYIEEYTQYNIEAKKVTIALTVACQEVLQYLEHNTAAKAKVAHELSWLTMAIISYSHIMIQLCVLNRVFMALQESTDDSIRCFIQKFVAFDESGKIKKVHFVNIEHLSKEVHRLQRIGSASVWNSLNTIWHFTKIYDPELYEEEWDKLVESNDTLSMLTLYVRYNGLDNAINPNKDNKPYENSFDSEYYKDHVQRLYHFAKQKLIENYNKTKIVPIEEQNQHSNQTALKLDKAVNKCETYDKKKLITYDKENLTLKICDFEIKFKKRGQASDILSIMTKNDISLHTKWEWDVMHEEMEGREPGSNSEKNNKYKRSLHDSYKHINEQVEEQSNNQLKGFIKFDMNIAFINTDYLRNSIPKNH